MTILDPELRAKVKALEEKQTEERTKHTQHQAQCSEVLKLYPSLLKDLYTLCSTKFPNFTSAFSDETALYPHRWSILEVTFEDDEPIAANQSGPFLAALQMKKRGRKLGRIGLPSFRGGEEPPKKLHWLGEAPSPTMELFDEELLEKVMKKWL